MMNETKTMTKTAMVASSVTIWHPFGMANCRWLWWCHCQYQHPGLCHPPSTSAIASLFGDGDDGTNTDAIADNSAVDANFDSISLFVTIFSKIYKSLHRPLADLTKAS